MSEHPYARRVPWAPAREISTAALLGQVLFLVAVALGFAAMGGVLGRDLDPGTARLLSFAGFGMLIVAAFVQRLRFGSLGMGWLFATALVIGMGIGPFLNTLIEVQPGAVQAAAGGTALTVLACGLGGFALSRDLAPWMRPLSIAVLVLVVVSIVAVVFTSALSPFLSLLIFGVSALLIVVDFNYLRKHGTEADAVWLATGIFVSIINIFLSLLNIFSSD
jgi:modulator of FtsH protease